MCDFTVPEVVADGIVFNLPQCTKKKRTPQTNPSSAKSSPRYQTLNSPEMDDTFFQEII